MHQTRRWILWCRFPPSVPTFIKQVWKEDRFPKHSLKQREETMSYWRSLSLLSSTLVSPSASRFAFLGLGVVQQPAFGAILGSRFKHSFKTSRSAYKRFRVRGNGSLKRWVKFCWILFRFSVHTSSHSNMAPCPPQHTCQKPCWVSADTTRSTIFHLLLWRRYFLASLGHSPRF